MKAKPYYTKYTAALLIVLSSILLPIDTVEAQGGVNRRGGLGKLFKRIKTNTKPDTPAVEPVENKTVSKKSNTPSDPKALALKSILMNVIPADRHYRETLANAIVQVYHQRRYKNIWNHRQMPERLFSSLSPHLVRHGLPGIMVLDPNAIASFARKSPVNARDLGYTVAIADAGSLVKMGAVSPETLWPKWNTGDTPGSNRWSADAIAKDINQIASYTTFSPGTAVDSMAPRNWIYRELQNGYIKSQAAYSGNANLPTIPNPSSSGAARPGKAYAHAPALAETLVQKGYLIMAEADRRSLTSVTPKLTEGIKNFQRSNGLTADGIMGSGTWKKLTTNEAGRYKARTINLHRARLLGDTLGERYVIVNLPSAELFGFEPNDKHVMTMRIVHGKTDEEDFHTPVFRDVMREVVFAPYWNVPESISTKEIYPKLLEDHTYMERNRYEIVSNFNDDTEVHEYNEATLEKIGTGDLWLRQKPTGHNALGKVKFLLPNRFNIYLHDTPSKQYFKMSDRAQSHGCIRLASPPQLAEWTLKTQGWDDAKVLEKMDSESQIREKLDKPVNVFITYFTAFPRPVGTSTGKFALGPARDVYQKDSVHEAVLSSFLP